jgi:hypothetical protein
MEPALARELRENCGYLKDEGWIYTAQLMEQAADEIDRLASETERLRRALGPADVSLIGLASLRPQQLLRARVRAVVGRIFR